jgi:hypothetical protein
MEKSERSWRNIAVAIGLGAAASVGTGAVASLSLEMMMGGSSLDSVYQRLEARQPVVASSDTRRLASASNNMTGSVPEPTTWALMVTGVGAGMRARRSHSQA